MQKAFQFFRQNAKSVLLFFDKMRKVFQFFLQKPKSVYKMQYRLGNFLLVYSFLVFLRIFLQKLIKFFNMCASSEHLTKFFLFFNVLP